MQGTEEKGQIMREVWLVLAQTIKVDSTVLWQRAKKVVSDSPGLVDFAIGLMNSVFNLHDGQVSDSFLGIRITEEL